MLRVLTPSRQAQLADARDALAALRDTLTGFGATAEDVNALATSVRQLDDFFLLVVIGEFNSGKSAFINALLGRRVLEEGVTPTTARIHLVTYGDTISREVDAQGLYAVTAPVDLLRDVHIVDTPGTNAIIREHERLTVDFAPRSDLVLFVTSADRPFTETERQILAALRDWGKKIVIIVNKIDIFADPSELEQVVAFVTQAARDLLGATPTVLPVSARLALRAKQGEPALWASSGFEPLERFLSQTLDEESRFRLKLANPLGVGRVLAARYSAIAAERLTLLDGDLELLADIERQIAVYKEDMRSGFDLRMSAIGKALGDMEARGHRFFEDTLRIGRVVDLLNRARMQKEFTEKVVADAPQEIERRVTELIDWMVDQDFRQWQGVTARLADRQREHAARMLGAPDVGSFHQDRGRLIESIGREARRAVDTYDRHREAEIIADQARVAVAAAAAAGGAAVGLGTLVTVAASTVAADVTGILLASVVLGVGFLIIPARRRRARATLEQKIASMAERLMTALGTEFQNAQERSAQRLADAVSPYTRFVRAEERRWRGAERTLNALARRVGAILAAVSAAAYR
ncbi:MAG: dynamin family protein [Betaproteobacteria bacterium]